MTFTRSKHFFAWPGLGDEAHDPDIRSIDDLVSLVLSKLDEPADLVAQSMGGLIAMKVALGAPDRVRCLVLTATSGGLPVGALGGNDWRSDYQRIFPKAAPWIADASEDLSSQLHTIKAPCLLLWGEADDISPPAVGKKLNALLPNSDLHIIGGADHDMAETHAAEIAPLIEAHLR